MFHTRKIAVVTTLLAIVIVGMAAFRPQDDKPKRNLKVLPKDISKDSLDHVMHGWAHALGVKCNFCHAPSKDSSSRRLDFASDEKPEKNIARHMYKMAGKINKKYFSFNKNDEGLVVPAVTCVTCHRGSPHPDEVK
ncbi:MAG TPA: c-type cytochrome [Puia sp.]|nr:c-type cytochrome [Puia sp.]